MVQIVMTNPVQIFYNSLNEFFYNFELCDHSML